MTAKKMVGKDGKVHEVHFVRVAWDLNKTTGQYVMKEVAGSEFVLQVDLVLLAMGFVHVEHAKWLAELGVQFDGRGNIQTNGAFMSTVPGVFAAGDAVRGASLVVWAIQQGRQAAKAVDAYLKQVKR